MHAAGAGVRGIHEDATGQFSLDIQIELLDIRRRIGPVRSLKGVRTGVKRRNIARPSKRRLRFGPNGPFVGQFREPEGAPGVNAQPVAVSVLLGVIPPFVVATHRVDARLIGSLLGFRLKYTQFGMKKMP